MHAVRIAGLLLVLLTGGCAGLERASQDNPRGTGALDLLVLPAAFTQEPSQPQRTLQQLPETPPIGEGERK